MKRRALGFTLVEIAIVMTLTLSLLTLTAVYFTRGQRFAAETETYASVQSEANTLLRRIADDAYRGSAEQLDVSAGSVVFLSFSSNDEPDKPIEFEAGTGKILWKAWVGYYFNPSEGVVYRCELPLTTFLSDPAATASPELDAVDLMTRADVKRRPVARGVRAFTILRAGRGLRVQVTTEGMAPIAVFDNNQREVLVTVKTQIALLN